MGSARLQSAEETPALRSHTLHVSCTLLICDDNTAHMRSFKQLGPGAIVSFVCAGASCFLGRVFCGRSGIELAGGSSQVVAGAN